MPIALTGVRYWSDENRPTWTIIMTILFFPHLVKGSNVTQPIPYDESAMSSTFTSTTTAQENEAIYLWIPLIIVIIFAMIITTLIIVGRQTHRAGCKCLGAPSSLESSSDETVTSPRRNLTLNVNLNCNSTDPIVPETPPPSYAVISRQISYISTISQTSSQIEIPPGYDEAIDIPEGTPRRSKNRGSQQYSSRGSASSQSQGQGGVVSRIRLFSRSSSATDSPRRPALLRQQSTPSENGNTVLPPADAILELDHPVVVPVTPTTLDIIHETTTGAEDVHLDSPTENNVVSRFYIDESELHNETTS